MADIVAFPRQREYFLDARADRALRLTWHHECGFVVLSLWKGDACTGTFRLPAEDVPRVVQALTSGLVEGYSAGALIAKRTGA